MSSENNRVGIFVATMTGLADMCGEEIEDALTCAGLDCERQLMDGLDTSAFEEFGLIVIVTSTYGHGEIPDNGQALFASAQTGADLADKKYAIFSLGDRTYADTFCAAGDRFDAVMAACGATRLVEIERHDASSGTLAEDVAGEWATGWADQFA
ncbi:MioC protein [Sphingobium wenxiniae]|uniref:MioC protein n=1 Tax=Sphingobium wenxiniae (strain DSM 21828 / CGMCC 1.7748 / JZ-1) TaxID=595605 RepID=A0A562K3W3_SPHWJ|nr:flavodoxin domain-containing protein [Sphingobium wenxiniae]MBB6193387.1 MioC protein [Sphingobium wenxiniae]MBE5075049.1 flavodoxin domain-containing protein [Erythrobacteraceae bacterium E2-1 Yellow Sea]NIO43410.1 nitric oxide synthase [Burkholderiales bacterium]TWH90112.1 MioC protein [Sphingobium wenxiniae]